MFLRKTRTYVHRQRKLRPHLERLWNEDGGPLSLHDPRLPLFLSSRDPSRPLIIDVGFGMGHTLIAQAIRYPNCDFIGIEVHRPGLARAWQQCCAQGLENLHLIEGDALLVLERFSKASCDGLYIHFPDPWPKTRHHKRRLIRHETVPIFLSLLKPYGFLSLRTDDAHYHEAMRRALSDFPLHLLKEAEQPEWVSSLGISKFHARALSAHQTVYAMCYQLEDCS